MGRRLPASIANDAVEGNLMPDPLCHAAQGSIMMVGPFITRIRRKSTLFFLAFAGAILGDLPDLIGAYGILFRHDNGDLYRAAHLGEIKEVLQYIPMYWLHLFLDSFTHTMEDRMSLWNEWVGFEAVAWTINLALIALLIWIWRKKAAERRSALATTFSRRSRKALGPG
jgi:hypothetical protein